MFGPFVSILRRFLTRVLVGVSSASATSTTSSTAPPSPTPTSSASRGCCYFRDGVLEGWQSLVHRDRRHRCSSGFDWRRFMNFVRQFHGCIEGVIAEGAMCDPSFHCSTQTPFPEGCDDWRTTLTSVTSTSHFTAILMLNKGNSTRYKFVHSYAFLSTT